MVIKVQKAMLYTKCLSYPVVYQTTKIQWPNNQDTVATVGAGQEIQDGVQDGSHKQIQGGGLLNDMLHGLKSF